MSVVFLGAEIIKAIGSEGLEISEILEGMSKALEVSYDHMVLALEWIFIIDAVFVDDGRVKIYDAA
ncbi:ABC-three component system middle component 6 [Pseudomonas mosselii]|uniref:ABC-three component system middle component 6 n=1 Tax=Pseudomonas mosselii TaxID=78327 RepID=UPI0032E4CD4E